MTTVQDSWRDAAMAEAYPFVFTWSRPLSEVNINGLPKVRVDHAMLTGMLAVRNILFGERNDLWSVNTNSEYQEELHTDEQYCVNDFTEALSRVDVSEPRYQRCWR